MDRLATAFSELGAANQAQARTAQQPQDRKAPAASTETASASLPKQDRKMVRLPATGDRILAAARSSAPRVNLQRAQA